MQYKTIVLALLQQRPQMHDQLRKNRSLMPTLEAFARELMDGHEAWKEVLWQENPTRDPTQISSEALELALKQLEDRLPSVTPRDETEALSLDEAIEFICRHTPPG